MGRCQSDRAMILNKGLTDAEPLAGCDVATRRAVWTLFASLPRLSHHHDHFTFIYYLYFFFFLAEKNGSQISSATLFLLCFFN